MQSTLPSVLKDLRGTRLYLSDCMSALYESSDSQAETAARVPELAGFTLMNQSRRMMQRPLSLQGVELADGNRFFVNLGSQAETCARPLLFQNGEFKPAFTAKSTSEEIEMTTTPDRTPFAWDFRASSVDTRSLERNFDWPALDEDEYARPEYPRRSADSHVPRVWSKEPSLSRIPALRAKNRKSTVEVDTLRELLQEAMDREAQRITLKTQAFKPNAEADESDKPGVLASAKQWLNRLVNQFSQLGKTWVRA